MNKELAKTLTTALVQFIDKERPEGTMDCSSGECVSLEKAFTEENFDSVETLINKKLSRLTEFEKGVDNAFICVGLENVPYSTVKRIASELLYIAKKQLLSYADESNPAIEAMADLERTFECNPDKLPGWLKDELNKAFKKGQELSHEDYVQGYTNGYKDAEKRYNESVAYHYPDPIPTGMPYQSPQCGTNVTIVPNINSGTSTAKAEG